MCGSTPRRCSVGGLCTKSSVPSVQRSGASLGARARPRARRTPGLAGAPVCREPCARVGHARRSGCPSRQLAGNSGALCCPVQSLLLYILTPYRETAVSRTALSRVYGALEGNRFGGSMPPPSRDNTRSKARGAPPPRVRTGVNQEVSFIEVEAGSDAATRPLKRLASQCHRPNSGPARFTLHAGLRCGPTPHSDSLSGSTHSS